MSQGPDVGGSCPTCGTEGKPQRGWEVVGEVEVSGEVGGVFSTGWNSHLGGLGSERPLDWHVKNRWQELEGIAAEL